MNMDFCANKTLKVFKKGASWGTYLRDILSGVNGKWYRKSWKVFNDFKMLIWC